MQMNVNIVYNVFEVWQTNFFEYNEVVVMSSWLAVMLSDQHIKHIKNYPK